MQSCTYWRGGGGGGGGAAAAPSRLPEDSFVSQQKLLSFMSLINLGWFAAEIVITSFSILIIEH